MRKIRECDKQEKRVCKKLGGKVQVASGSTAFLKGDGVLDDLLIECKTKNNICKSVAVRKEWFDKIKKEAYSTGKSGGIVVFSFGDGKDYVCENINEFKEHYKAYRKLLDVECILSNRLDKNSLEDVLDRLEDIRGIILDE